MRVSRLLTIGAIVVATSSARDAHACSCVVGAPPCQSFFDVSAVFVGTVRSIDQGAGASSFARRRIILDVVEAFRGVAGQRVEVDTGAGGGDCGYPFEVGMTYLVYASVAKDTQVLTTGICTRTKPVSGAQEDLAFARSVTSAPATGGVVTGTVRNRDRRLVNPPPNASSFAPVAGVTVVVECDGLTYRAESDDRGRFEVGGLATGACTPRVVPPDAMFVASPPPSVTIRDLRSCAALDIVLGFDGRIRGRIVDASLQPIAGVTVDALVPGERSPSYMYAAVTDAAGAYEIANMPPGNYVVGVNARRAYRPGAPSFGRAAFFPSASSAGTAQIVRVGEGEQVSLGDFALPSTAAFVQLSGEAVTASGSPAAGAKVYVIRPEPGFQVFSGPLVSDAQGRFTVAIPRGERVKIWVELARMGRDGTRTFDRGELPEFAADRSLVDQRIIVGPVRR